MTASTVTLSAMEPVLRVIVLAENIAVSIRKKRITTLHAMINVRIRMSSLPIIYGSVMEPQQLCQAV